MDDPNSAVHLRLQALRSKVWDGMYLDRNSELYEIRRLYWVAKAEKKDFTVQVYRDAAILCLGALHVALLDCLKQIEGGKFWYRFFKRSQLLDNLEELYQVIKNEEFSNFSPQDKKVIFDALTTLGLYRKYEKV